MDRHKVFISYHHENDESYRKKFEELFAGQVDGFISRSVEIGDIDPNLNTETVFQKIREDHLRDSSVTVVLVGRDTWRRKYVDWEIGASIRKTKTSPRSGLLGILLPTYPRSAARTYNRFTIPPRLWMNVDAEYAAIYDWDENAANVLKWIDDAFKARLSKTPNNARRYFGKNQTGERWYPQP